MIDISIQSKSIPSIGYFQNKEEISTGTTLVAIEYKGGVVVGTDSRTSSGSFIASRCTDKITRINSSIVVCRCGSAADTQTITDVVKYNLEINELIDKKKISVYDAGNEFRKLLYNYRESLSAATIVAGYDNKLGGQVYSIISGGTMNRQTITSLGSGSTFIHTYLDSNWRTDLTKNDCINLIRSAVFLATSRDGSSGGVIRLAIIDKNGTQRLIYRPDQGEYPYIRNPLPYKDYMSGFKNKEIEEEIID
ncbi:Proteasome subunit beta type-6 [Strongyloides ratti]|uniref:Proteasome subunit beta n=1 Tax=Strongyloides ratti TaxID=34506 RepID=A0A090LSA0_STRRB|nr:Proteasome subunit beta type-6 [Strongyloides ratti]CEF70478.1 Proteasome subunit beta type-6 [Strongyloides ratti]